MDLINYSWNGISLEADVRNTLKNKLKWFENNDILCPHQGVPIDKP